MIQAWGRLRSSSLLLDNIKHYNDTIFRGKRHVLTVSTTRGTPSSSTDLKEALCEKIPIHYDLLRNFRQQYGSSVITHVTVENIYQGLNGVNVLIRETSEIDPKYGIRYRGLTIPEIVTLLPRNGKSPFVEAVFWLLLTGDVPTKEQTASLISDWSMRRQRRKDWWSGPGGGIVGSVLRTLPKNISPLGKLSVALTIFDSSKHMKDALRKDALNHTLWEYTYEDGMELLATLPALVGLVARNDRLESVKEETIDWVEFLSDSLISTFDISDNHRKPLMDFLRLYITLNADENGGIPGIHVTEILGACQVDINQALAAGALAYSDEPKSGTLLQYIDFQRKIQRLLGTNPKEDKLRNYIATLIKRDRLIGYNETNLCDPRYIVLENYARECLPNDSDMKMSQNISHILTAMMKTAKGKTIYPDQNVIAAPIFQFYGLNDMQFNQIFLFISRTLGSVASIIWNHAINAVVENPTSKSTYSYLNSVQGIRGKRKRGKPVKIHGK